MVTRLLWLPHVHACSPTFINHSCNPNCIAVFDGHTVKIRTVRNIKPDEQVSIQKLIRAGQLSYKLHWSKLFIGYCDLLDTGERRQEYLQKYHLFQCGCNRCSDEERDGSPMTSSVGVVYYAQLINTTELVKLIVYVYS